MAQPKKISKRQFLLLQRTAPIELSDFARYEELEPTQRPWGVVATLAFEYRPRKEWNSKGREIFSTTRIKRLAALLYCFQKDFSMTEWILESTAKFWWRKGLTPCKLTTIQKLSPWNIRQLYGYSGGLLLTDCDPSFFNLLIALPYCLNICTINMFSLSNNIIVQFSDHLDILILTQDRLLWDEICIWTSGKKLPTVTHWA